jgi:hypothetical protein
MDPKEVLRLVAAYLRESGFHTALLGLSQDTEVAAGENEEGRDEQP